MKHDPLFHQSDEVTRRAFVSGAARTLLGLGTLPLVGRLGFAADSPVPLRPATAAVPRTRPEPTPVLPSMGR